MLTQQQAEELQNYIGNYCWVTQPDLLGEIVAGVGIDANDVDDTSVVKTIEAPAAEV